MPDQYACLSEEQREAMGKISSDFCTITHDGGTDHFIRAVLEVPIHGVEAVSYTHLTLPTKRIV